MPEARADEVLGEIVAAFTGGDYRAGPAARAARAWTQALAPDAILDSGLVAGIREVGEMFRRGEAFLPEMMLAAEAWQAGHGRARAAHGRPAARRGQRQGRHRHRQG